MFKHSNKNIVHIAAFRYTFAKRFHNEIHNFLLVLACIMAHGMSGTYIDGGIFFHYSLDASSDLNANSN